MGVHFSGGIRKTMTRILPILTTALLLTAGTSLLAQATAPDDKSATRARAGTTKTDTDVTYGSIKELTAGQKVVVDVDNAPDKTFDLNDKSVTVKLGKGLKIGDPVMVTEHENMGKTKSVTIAKHTGGGVVHGDKDPAAKKP
jgi:hypothetical protein